MRIKLALLSAFLITLTVGGIAATTVPAHAALGIQICDNKCLNGWNGGSVLKTYDPNVFNDNFVLDFVSGRCQSGSFLTTANCPISGVPAGLDIVQIKETYVANGNNECVGDYQDMSGRADAETFDVCNNDQTGFGGDYGTIFVLGTDCGSQSWELFNSHFSSNFGTGRRDLGSDFNSDGNQIYLNVNTPYFCMTESNIT